MKITSTSFEGLLVLEPEVFEDSRGYFFESYNKRKLGFEMEFVQDNQSFSTHGVLRGMHFQKPPFAQTKLVRALRGTIQDVVVDLRVKQPTYGKWFSLELSDKNRKQLLVPRGFAHGFLVLSEFAETLYKSDSYYHPESEGGIFYDDPAVGIRWQLPMGEITLSEKDKHNPVLSALPAIF